LPELRSRLFAPARDPLWGAISALLVSLLVSFVAIAVSGKDAVAGFGDLLSGAFGGAGPLGETAIKSAVLILTGLSVAVAFTVGLFNIGAEGQLIWGGLAAAVVGQADFPGAMLCSLAAAALAGALWGLLAGWLKVRRGIHEVISTILLNWIAIHLVHGWLVPGPLGAAGSGATVSVAGTSPIVAAATLPRFFRGSRFDLGFPLALLAAGATWLLLTRTWRGFEWRATGANREAARASGIPAERRICEGMALSGALAGLGGALLILGTEHKYPGVFRTGYGFDGIAVALVGSGTAFGTTAAAVVFGALRAGATRLQLVGIHPSFAELTQGFAVLLVAAPRIFVPLFARLRGRPGPAASAPPIPTVPP
jgi:general nucleoside transport system permease protein